MSIILTEKQRQDAIAACDRIVELNNDIQRRWAEIIRIFDDMAKPKAQEPKS